MYKKAEVEYLRFLLKGLTVLRKYAYMRFSTRKQAQKGAPRFGGELLIADPVTQNRILDEVGGNLTPGTLSQLNRENVERTKNILEHGVITAIQVGAGAIAQNTSRLVQNWLTTFGRHKAPPPVIRPSRTVITQPEPMPGGIITGATSGLNDLFRQPLPHRTSYEEQQRKARELAEQYRR